MEPTGDDMDKTFLEGLAALVNVKPEEVADLFVTEGQETKLKDGVNLLNVTSGWVKTRLDDVYKAAQRKTASSFESAIKSKGFESDKQGVELLDAYLETVKSKPGGGDPSEWEKKYNDLAPKVENLQKALQAKDVEIQKAVKDGQRREVQARLITDVRKALGDKWAGSEDHFGILMNNFNIDRIRYDNGVPVLLDESGEVAKDDLHRPIAFDDRVKHYGNLIGGFHAVDPKKDGAPPPKGGSGASGGVKLPADITSRQFTEMYAAASAEEKAGLLEARKAQLQSK